MEALKKRIQWKLYGNVWENVWNHYNAQSLLSNQKVICSPCSVIEDRRFREGQWNAAVIAG